MEPGTHYLAKLELIIMFHGALRKFRGIAQTRAKGWGGGRVEGEVGGTSSSKNRGISRETRRALIARRL